mgnify:CR=1 FL=1
MNVKICEHSIFQLPEYEAQYVKAGLENPVYNYITVVININCSNY